MTTKDLVFEYIRSTQGHVNLQELTDKVLKNDPFSKWDNSHWGYYRTNITSANGRFADQFSPEIKSKLRLQTERVHRSPEDIPSRSNYGITRSHTSDWPIWNIPTDEEEQVLARVLLPYVKILQPSIVELISEDNNKQLGEWRDKFEALGINAGIYLWENSPVTFPGVRRHVGSQETTLFRSGPKQSKGENALFLDDNTYPKQIWSFALRNKPHGMKNPENYSLAHIVDHKDHNTRNVSEVKGYEKVEEKNLFAGLYTSCANIIYIPTSFVKPTDHNSKIRRLLIQIVYKYYGNLCNILPYNLKFNLDAITEQWKLENFPEPSVVGNLENTKHFLEYRNRVINERINQLQSSAVH
jgi:hypothetical protein